MVAYMRRQWRTVPELSVHGDVRRTSNDAERFFGAFGSQFPVAHPGLWEYMARMNKVRMFDFACEFPDRCEKRLKRG